MLKEAEAGYTKAEVEYSTPFIDSENVSKERAKGVLQKLLLLSSVEILETIQSVTYLSASEVYS